MYDEKTSTFVTSLWKFMYELFFIYTTLYQSAGINRRTPQRFRSSTYYFSTCSAKEIEKSMLMKKCTGVPERKDYYSIIFKHTGSGILICSPVYCNKPVLISLLNITMLPVFWLAANKYFPEGSMVKLRGIIPIVDW